MKRVLVVPDSFKGTLSSREVCRIISSTLKEKYQDIIIKEIPVADGGEGTAEAFLYSSEAKKIYCQVKSPLGKDITAYFVMLGDGTAVIEMALASGLTIEKKNNAVMASSYGTGQLIKSALDNGARKLVIGIGGSATTDCGTGCLSALGAVFYDKDNNEVIPCGKTLSQIEEIDLSHFDKRLNEVEITVLCDVTNPLYGEKGAAYTYARQKGADDMQIRELDEGLRHFSKVCSEKLKKDFSFTEGAGAAGGIGFAFISFMNGRLCRGIDAVLDCCDFENEAEKADIIITGEGRMDSQSLMGKVPFGVAKRSKGKNVIAVVGINELTYQQYKNCGISQVIETNPERLPFDFIQKNAERMLYDAVNRIKI